MFFVEAPARVPHALPFAFRRRIKPAYRFCKLNGVFGRTGNACLGKLYNATTFPI